jgi:hypothetical protein
MSYTVHQLKRKLVSTIHDLAACSAGGRSWQGAVYFDLALMVLTFAGLICTEGAAGTRRQPSGSLHQPILPQPV